jgi:hypothetical protein
MEHKTGVILARENGHGPIGLVQMGESVGEDTEGGHLQLLAQRLEGWEAVGELINRIKEEVIRMGNLIAEVSNVYHGVHQRNAAPLHLHVLRVLDQSVLKQQFVFSHLPR